MYGFSNCVVLSFLEGPLYGLNILWNTRRTHHQEALKNLASPQNPRFKPKVCQAECNQKEIKNLWNLELFVGIEPGIYSTISCWSMRGVVPGYPTDPRQKFGLQRQATLGHAFLSCILALRARWSLELKTGGFTMCFQIN